MTNLHQTDRTTWTPKQYTTKETAQLIRVALKAAFPGVTFSVRTSYASMTSSTDVRWTDGPTQAEVEQVTNRFTSRGFDGSTDSTTYHDQDFGGERVSFSGWVHVSRDLSPALLERAIVRFQFHRADYDLPPVNVDVQPNGRLEGPDLNRPAGVNPCGYRFSFQYVSDAILSIAHTMRPNGCVVTLKAVR